MIYDRTREDVDLALQIRAEKVQQGILLTQEEIDQLERGFLTINTLNRIESKQSDLRTLFNAMGYWNTPIETKTWTKDDIFTGEDAARIIENDRILRRAFFVLSNTPSVGDYLYDFENTNAVEQVLNDAEYISEEMRAMYKRCGVYRCGQILVFITRDEFILMLNDTLSNYYTSDELDEILRELE